MEIAQANESTPLLRNGATSDESGQLKNSTASDEPTSLNENGVVSNQENPSSEQDGGLDTKPDIISPSTTEQMTNEVSLKEVVEALCSAWERNMQDAIYGYELKKLKIFTLKEWYAMHLAWENVTRDRRCLAPAHEIAEALALAMMKVVYPSADEDEDDSQDMNCYFRRNISVTKNRMAAELLEDWDYILENDGWGQAVFPDRYTLTMFENPVEEPPPVSNFCLRQVELYDQARKYFTNPKLQVVVHTLLIIWPISLLVIGSKFVDCPMSHHLSRLFMILGCAGCLATMFRLALMFFYSYSESYFSMWKWRSLKLIEFTFLIVFIIQAYHFFNNHQTTEPDPDHCAEKFYITALVMNCVSIVFVLAFLIVYFIIFCSKQFNIWRWLFRHF